MDCELLGGFAPTKSSFQYLPLAHTGVPQTQIVLSSRSSTFKIKRGHVF